MKDENGDVIPMQYLGVIDTELSEISTQEVLDNALINLWSEDKEGGYFIRHARHPAGDLPPRNEHDAGQVGNFWE